MIMYVYGITLHNTVMLVLQGEFASLVGKEQASMLWAAIRRRPDGQEPKTPFNLHTIRN